MEPFFCPPTRKKLPGKHGQQDLIAARAAALAKHLSHCKIYHFPTWHGFRSVLCEPRLGRALAVRRIRNQPGRAWPRIVQGENHRWRTRFSIGLSRQMILERQLDVVANNVANVNTTGLQGRQVAVRGISEVGRARRQLRAETTAASASSRTAAPSTISRKAPPSRPRIRWMSRSTATAFWWCRRRPASATPATAACSSTTRASS